MSRKMFCTFVISCSFYAGRAAVTLIGKYASVLFGQLNR